MAIPKITYSTSPSSSSFPQTLKSRWFQLVAPCCTCISWLRGIQDDQEISRSPGAYVSFHIIPRKKKGSGFVDRLIGRSGEVGGYRCLWLQVKQAAQTLFACVSNYIKLALLIAPIYGISRRGPHSQMTVVSFYNSIFSTMVMIKLDILLFWTFTSKCSTVIPIQ